MKIFTKKFWYSFLIDIGFLVFVMFFALGSQKLAEYIRGGNLALGFILVILYFILLTVFYCIAKYTVWKIILEKTRCSFKRFLIYNFIILFGFFIIFTVLTVAIILLVQEQYLRTYIAIIVIFFMIASYIFYSPSQLAILLKAEKKFWKLMRKNIGRFLIVIGAEFVFLVIIYLIFVGVFQLTKGRVDLNLALQWIGFFVIILFNVFNRIYIYDAFKRSLEAAA